MRPPVMRPARSSSRITAEGGHGFAGAALAHDAQASRPAERRSARHRAAPRPGRCGSRRRPGDPRPRSSASRAHPGVEDVAQPVAEQVEAQHRSISARPGKTTSHHLPVVMKRAPSATMMPHSGVGGRTPRPMKDRPAALRIAQPRLSEICTAMAGSTLGSRKRSTTGGGCRRRPAPPPPSRAPRRTFTSARAKRM